MLFLREKANCGRLLSLQRALFQGVSGKLPGRRQEAGHSHAPAPERWVHVLNYALGMDALATVCSWNTNVVRHWAWMRSGHDMLLENKRYDTPYHEKSA